MNVIYFFEQEKGISVISALNAHGKYTAIDLCQFAKKYHESEIKNLPTNSVLSVDANDKIPNIINILSLDIEELDETQKDRMQCKLQSLLHKVSEKGNLVTELISALEKHLK